MVTKRLKVGPRPNQPACTPDGKFVYVPCADGAWWVQDAAAALPARLLGDLAGRAVADLCAAPGGKTLQLAAAGARLAWAGGTAGGDPDRQAAL